jgi:precorrin-2 dehydrogenase/sirohydrochlorin ferrochelatase
MRYYPINLNIKGKVCIVIGGGKVAERKIRNILLCGGKVKVISPELTEPLAQIVRRRRINYRKDEYHSSILEGAFLAYAATSDRKVNAQVAKDAARLGILVNVCDSARESTFIVPAVLRKGGITISVSTDGVSPAKSVSIRDRLKKLI